MKTLIELYDDTPIENVLAADTFCPERTVFLCPQEIAQDKVWQKKMTDYFQARGTCTDCVFLNTSLFYANKVIRQLKNVIETYEDCAIDIAGGSDAALFASGVVSVESDIPVFTHSRKKQKFFNIRNSEFAENLPFSVKYTVEDFFMMAGGAMKPGRVENEVLNRYVRKIDSFFELYLKYRKVWNNNIVWFQRASNGKNNPITLHVDCDYSQKGEHGARINADEAFLNELAKLGFIKKLKIHRTQKRVTFDFCDAQVRYWLRDQGSVLEVYTWKAANDAGIFNDVRCSTIVDWDSTAQRDRVSNEIDVMAVYDSIPVFISCKTCAIDTDAVNELAILRDRFGGDAAKAVIISTENCRAITRGRASALDIDVIDLGDLKHAPLAAQLLSLMGKDAGDERNE